MISRKLVPFILLFGLYLISYGHLSPGGGFQGGVVLASGIILLFLSHGFTLVQRSFPERRLNLTELVMVFFFLLLGLAGLLLGKYFLGNILPLGEAGDIPSAGFILLLNMIIGLKVGAGITLICFYLFRA
jgi:multicomponent Na+:H+ antiporter subunit B